MLKKGDIFGGLVAARDCARGIQYLSLDLIKRGKLFVFFFIATDKSCCQNQIMGDPHE